jgi:folate-dependent phosphoribosylglycinamide formyltransferase PurN
VPTAVIEYGVHWSGVTVHLVDVEHRLYPESLLFAENRIALDGRTVRIDDTGRH